MKRHKVTRKLKSGKVITYWRGSGTANEGSPKTMKGKEFESRKTLTTSQVKKEYGEFLKTINPLKKEYAKAKKLGDSKRMASAKKSFDTANKAWNKKVTSWEKEGYSISKSPASGAIAVRRKS